MAERYAALTNERLEGLLLAVRAELAFPSAADFGAAVRVRINQGTVERAEKHGAIAWSPRAALAGVLVAVMLAGALTLAFSSSARAVFYDALEGVDFDFVESGEETPETPGALARQLGTRVELEEAQAAVDFDIVAPAGLGDPDEVYLNSSLPGGVVTLLYTQDEELADVGGFGLLVTQFSGRTVKVKEVGPGTSVEEILVDGLLGYWIDGQHAISFRDAGGQDALADFRRSGASLVFERDGVTIRFESALGRDESIALAETLE